MCTETVGYFAKRIAEPPQPDVKLADLSPMRAVGPGASPSDRSHAAPPQRNRNNNGQPLQIWRAAYTDGMGVHAPNQLIFQIDPQWDRFVAVGGCDESIIDRENGTAVARDDGVCHQNS